MQDISLEQAQEVLLAHVSRIRASESIPLLDALGRELAKDYFAPFANPPFDRSPLDGYAFASASTKNASESQPAAFTIAGEDIQKSTLLAKKGTKLTAAHLGALVSMGFDKVEVIRQVRIAIASTSDELLQPGDKLQPGKIYNSNLYLNCVPIQQVNEAEIPALAGLAKDYPVKMRFIELMPIGCAYEVGYKGIKMAEVKRRIEAVYGKMIPVAEKQSRLAPGIPEAMRALSLKITPRAMLSRAQAGICKRTLIVNLPGSVKAVDECLHFILPSLQHGIEILRGDDSECGGHHHHHHKG